MKTFKIDGVAYVPATALAQRVGICRQTLWRWRRQGRIPNGHRHRNGQVIFTQEEAEEVFNYAFQVSPITGPGSSSETTSGASAEE